ncbi:hypothetical protein [Prochlorococcus marinus]|uniref:hypothetical protein n=1 Tax=Prochlorococcus marinus TaxID=1219 RepID=UPI0022B320F8|nr:hypothetical protein [Prochlorococcus marinus]
MLLSDGDVLRKADLTFYATQCDLAAQRTDDVALAREGLPITEREKTNEITFFTLNLKVGSIS